VACGEVRKKKGAAGRSGHGRCLVQSACLTTAGSAISKPPGISIANCPLPPHMYHAVLYHENIDKTRVSFEVQRCSWDCSWGCREVEQFNERNIARGQKNPTFKLCISKHFDLVQTPPNTPDKTRRYGRHGSTKPSRTSTVDWQSKSPLCISTLRLRQDQSLGGK